MTTKRTALKEDITEEILNLTAGEKVWTLSSYQREMIKEGKSETKCYQETTKGLRTDVSLLRRHVRELQGKAKGLEGAVEEDLARWSGDKITVKPSELTAGEHAVQLPYHPQGTPSDKEEVKQARMKLAPHEDKKETCQGETKQNTDLINQVKKVTKPYGRVVLTLKNCVLPEEKLSPTPSQNDGLDQETEMDLRILGCELIQTAGMLLKLPQVAMATGQVLFQRFYYSKSFVLHAMETTAMGCVYLASKIEEAPRRIRDVINVFHHIKQVKSERTIQPMILDQNYVALKTQVIRAERRVLKELGFCVHVQHPHKIIVMYLKMLGCEEEQGLMQLAWNYMNDSLRTDVFVRYQPEAVACACIYLASGKLNVSLPKDVQDVCLRILRLYERPKPNAEELERRVQELKARGASSCGVGATGTLSGNNTPGS
jgi:transcription initiation factor TFIIIB Brf1 subunit/transcription initiation factor TFIIB